MCSSGHGEELRKNSLKIACVIFMYSTPSFTKGADISMLVTSDMGFVWSTVAGVVFIYASVGVVSVIFLKGPLKMAFIFGGRSTVGHGGL